MWKPTQQPALWFHGGNLHQSRHYSQFLSLQLKARKEGLATPVYGLQKCTTWGDRTRRQRAGMKDTSPEMEKSHHGASGLPG
jgi:hypothetical protein